MVAAYWGETDVVMELMKAGANLDLQNEVYMSRDEHRYSRWSATRNIILLFVYES